MYRGIRRIAARVSAHVTAPENVVAPAVSRTPRDQCATFRHRRSGRPHCVSIRSVACAAGVFFSIDFGTRFER